MLCKHLGADPVVSLRDACASSPVKGEAFAKGLKVRICERAESFDVELGQGYPDLVLHPFPELLELFGVVLSEVAHVANPERPLTNDLAAQQVKSSDLACRVRKLADQHTRHRVLVSDPPAHAPKCGTRV